MLPTDIDSTIAHALNNWLIEHKTDIENQLPALVSRSSNENIENQEHCLPWENNLQRDKAIIDFCHRTIVSNHCRIVDVDARFSRISLSLAFSGYQTIALEREPLLVKAGRYLRQALVKEHNCQLDAAILLGGFPDSLRKEMFVQDRTNLLLLLNPPLTSVSDRVNEQILRAGFLFDQMIINLAFFGLKQSSDHCRAIIERQLGSRLQFEKKVFEDARSEYWFCCVRPIFKTKHVAQQVANNELVLQGGYKLDQGFAWLCRLPAHLSALAESSANKQMSCLRLYENGKELGPAHALHETIRNDGKGAFSHWQKYLYFSTSDNSDPNKNRREYMVKW